MSLKKNGRLKVDVEMALTERQRQICEHLIKGSATKRQLFVDLYEERGRAYQSEQIVLVLLSGARKRLEKIGVKLHAKLAPEYGRCVKQYYFDEDGISALVVRE